MGKKLLAATNWRDHFPMSPKCMPLKQGVCSGRGKVGGGLLAQGTHEGRLNARHSSLGGRTCESWAETQQLISCNAGQQGGMRLRPVACSWGRWGSFAASGSRGTARARQGLSDIFVSLLADMLPCQYSRCHASTAVSMPVPLLPGYAEGVRRGCQVALRMRRWETKPG